MKYKMTQYNDMYHSGVMGMKWGHRKATTDSGSNSKERTPEQIAKSKNIKKAVVGTAAVVTLAAAGVMYAKNKPAVDKFVKKFMDDQKISAAIKQGVKEHDAAQYAKTHKEDILKSAGQIKKYKEHLTDDEIKGAVKKLQTVRDLRQLQQDNIKNGANYAQAFLTYGTVAVAAYNLKNTPLIKDAKTKSKKKNE